MKKTIVQAVTRLELPCVHPFFNDNEINEEGKKLRKLFIHNNIKWFTVGNVDGSPITLACFYEGTRPKKSAIIEMVEQYCQEVGDPEVTLSIQPTQKRPSNWDWYADRRRHQYSSFKENGLTIDPYTM